MSGEDECVLPCLNGGRCVFEQGTEHVIARRALLGEMVQRCECPAGFTGLVCNIPIEVCSIQEDGRGFCPNGRPCTENRDSDGSITYSCECSRAEASSKFAGYMCRTPVTEYCGTGATSPFSFCTHGGTCLNFVGDAINDLPSVDQLGDWNGEVETPRFHDGCRCAPEYNGKFCEYLVGTGPEVDNVNVTQPTDVLPTGNGGGRWSTGGTIGISMGAVGLLAAIAVIIFVVARRRRRSERSHVLWTAVDEFLTKDSSRSLGGRSRGRNASSIGDDPSDPRGSKRGGSSRSISGRRSDMSSGQSASRSGSRSGTSGSRSGGRSSSRSNDSPPSGTHRARPLPTATTTSFRPIGEMTVAAQTNRIPGTTEQEDVYELQEEDLMDSGLDSDTAGHTSRSGSEYTR